MQIGFVGLGKMGASMVERIRRYSDHEVVAFDRNSESVHAAEARGAAGAGSLEELLENLAAPRAARCQAISPPAAPQGRASHGAWVAPTGRSGSPARSRWLAISPRRRAFPNRTGEPRRAAIRDPGPGRSTGTRAATTTI